MVEGIVSLPAEGEGFSLAMDRETLGQREVLVVDAGVAHDVLGGVAEIPLTGDGERRGIEPLVEGGTCGVGVADDIDALAIAAAGQVGTLNGAEADSGRGAADPLGNSGEGPIVQ